MHRMVIHIMVIPKVVIRRVVIHRVVMCEREVILGLVLQEEKETPEISRVK